ncbi:MAG: IS21 family transposase [Acidobacteriota bacterium]
MTIQELARRGWANTSIAETLGVSEGAVRYHRRRQDEGAADGRAKQVHRAAAFRKEIDAWLEAQSDEAALNLAALHEYLVSEHHYEGSLRSVQRFYRAHFPRPRKRARRRVETPPGSQAQADWAYFPGMVIGRRSVDVYAFHLQLSYSRFGAVVWSTRKDQLAWLWVHNQALERLKGVPATIRVDNEKTAVSRGAGPWGELNEAYRRYALTVRFHIDPCLPRSPEAKGKVERRIRDSRLRDNPSRRAWDSLEELQAWTDQRVLESAARRRCPATGTTVAEAWEKERQFLAPLQTLPEPFDVALKRKVTRDCMVHFEGRAYSVPFALIERHVEVRGCSGRVQILSGCQVVAEHPRHTARRVVIEPSHFEGEATDEVLPPQPLGRMGKRLQEIAALAPEVRPLDLYADLAAVAR